MAAKLIQVAVVRDDDGDLKAAVLVNGLLETVASGLDVKNALEDTMEVEIDTLKSGHSLLVTITNTDPVNQERT